ncbi:insulinase family protein [Bulleidia sp. zg-1006]|uniref:insulinase family protein n=1 Tax=Bulleidia sp. zg-1006 TaxID=2806552 RepID=UPI00193A5079|nr:insulinase family protein [Bulleidia sp. zg-1006]QRG86719.1 insulinase family protein [Bulleidia sp. zg-1006]
MQINEKYYGFTLNQIREVPDLKGRLYEFTHDKTDAKLNWIQTSDSNKTFSITFKTLPFDDTGVFHILEHSVLNGSKKYRTREPFVDLLKHSMQTFLNAMTYPDKTVYPVSSRNDKDFMNLMSVYMDAVFNPAIYENKNIFLQEGWRYEIRDAKENPKFNGVVLNEMKGAFADVYANIFNEMYRQLYPSNSYKYVSGGDPKAIPDLTYENFLETHKKFYHPSNARVILDGDVDIEATLKFIDEEYFSHYEKGQSFTIENQEILPARTSTIEIELAPEESVENRSYISFGKILGNFNELKKRMAMSIVHSILVGTNEAPLKKAILEAGLAQDVDYALEAELQQPFSILMMVNTEEVNLEKIKEVIRSVTKDYHFNPKELEASINGLEFHYREKSEPAGLLNALHSLETWLYDGDAMDGIHLSPIFDELRKAISSSYFEDVMKEFYGDEEHWATVIAKPSKTIAKKREEAEQARLVADKEKWVDVQPYIDEQLALDVWQATPDTKEQLDTMPKLALSDVNPEIMRFPTEEVSYRGIRVLVHPSDPSGIVHFNLYFSLAGLPKDKLPEVSFLARQLLGNLATEQYSLSELTSEIKNLIPVLSTNVTCFTPYNQVDGTQPFLEVTASTLEKNVDQAIALIQEILFRTKFEKEFVLNLLRQNNESIRQALVNSGNTYAVLRAKAHTSAEGFFNEYTLGITYGMYLQSLEDHFDEDWDGFLEAIQNYISVIFSRDRFILSVAGIEKEKFEDFIFALNTVKTNGMVVHYPLLTDEKEALQISGGVSYTGTSAKVEEYNSRYRAVAHLVTYDFLWTEVRVKNGAYGTGMRNDRSSLNTFSYRDPSPTVSLEVNQKIADYLRSFAKNPEAENDLNIIGSIASVEPLMNYRSQIKVGDNLVLSSITDDIRQAERENLLTMKKEDYLPLADIVEEMMKDSYQVVIGNEAMLSKLEDYKKLSMKE